ncbi:MAG TPA: FAD-dependent monooxygenase, partial [Solirubrobacteraceae bacterium]|nr:FAD-dependent monooxygenase [Solirubrobacteraceae bacterium]
PGGAHEHQGTWLGPHGAIVIYGVGRGELINVVAHHDHDSYRSESWITECGRSEPIERYGQWHESLKRLFSASEVWYKWALYDRDPIPRWTSGRATVLGDAAHPMLPYLGQGACQSMEDGCVLAAALAATPDDMPAGLELYERARRPRASRVVITSRERGVDNHLTSPLAALRRDVMIAVRKRIGSDQEGRGGSWIWDYDAGSPSALAA